MLEVVATTPSKPLGPCAVVTLDMLPRMSYGMRCGRMEGRTCARVTTNFYTAKWLTFQPGGGIGQLVLAVSWLLNAKRQAHKPARAWSRLEETGNFGTLGRKVGASTRFGLVSWKKNQRSVTSSQFSVCSSQCALLFL